MNIINGMTVLEQNMITIPSSQTHILLCISFIIMFGALIYMIIMSIKFQNNSNIDVDAVLRRSITMCIIGASITIIGCFLPGSNADTGRYKYKCLFEDYVTVNDITEIYDIISVEDDIWTVQDKNIEKR